MEMLFIRSISSQRMENIGRFGGIKIPKIIYYHYIVVAFASEIDCQVCPFDDAKM